MPTAQLADEDFVAAPPTPEERWAEARDTWLQVAEQAVREGLLIPPGVGGDVDDALAVVAAARRPDAVERVAEILPPSLLGFVERKLDPKLVLRLAQEDGAEVLLEAAREVEVGLRGGDETARREVFEEHLRDAIRLMRRERETRWHRAAAPARTARRAPRARRARPRHRRRGRATRAGPSSLADPDEPDLDGLQPETARVATSRVWAAVMLALHVETAASILAGRAVRAGTLDPFVLRRALRGGPLPDAEKYGVVTDAMLDAIAEAGALPPQVGSRRKR
jgi:hypothetical protein